MKNILIITVVVSFIILNLQVVTNYNDNTDILIKSLVSVSVASAENTNTDPCIQRYISVVNRYDCSYNSDYYGTNEIFYWCDGGGTGTCRNGDVEAWWDCEGKQGGVDYTTIDPC